MRFYLPLLVFLTTSCMQSPGGGKKSSAITASTNGGGTTTSGSTTGGGTNTSGVAMRYAYPSWPSSENAGFYYIPSFAVLRHDEYSRREAAKTTSSSTSTPVMPIQYSDPTNGSNFCFSNEEWYDDESGRLLFPKCVKANSTVVNHIKDLGSGSGRHPVFINAIQLNFKNSREGAHQYFSQVQFEGAYVEKGTISFNETSGRPIITNRNRYNYGTEECRVGDKDTVGFVVDEQSPHVFLLSGLATFERGKKIAFGEGLQEGYESYDPTECGSSGSGYLCNLIADKVSVWHSLFVPVLYKNNRTGALRLSHRQFPSQVVDSGRLTGTKGSAVSHYGYNSTANIFSNIPQTGKSDASVVSTPVMGKVDRDGNVIPNWEQSFITGFCLKGKRKEKLGWTSLIQAAYFELKSPRIEKKN